MPLPDMSAWEHDPYPEPTLGFAFYCETCGQVCELYWADLGALGSHRPHDWTWASKCCGARYQEKPL